MTIAIKPRCQHHISSFSHSKKSTVYIVVKTGVCKIYTSVLSRICCSLNAQTLRTGCDAKRTVVAQYANATWSQIIAME